MRIALRHGPGLVTEQTLNLEQIDLALHESCGERVPHVVDAAIGNSAQTPRFAKLPNPESHLKGIAQRSKQRW